MSDECHFYNAETKRCSEVDGVKRLIKWIVGILVTIAIPAFGYFAHTQDKTHDLMLKQVESVTEIKAIIKYQVLPSINGEKERADDSKSSLGRFGDNWNESAEAWHYPTGRVGGD